MSFIVMGINVFKIIQKKKRQLMEERRAKLFDPNCHVAKSTYFDFQREICRRSLLSLQDIEELSKTIDNTWLSACTTDSYEPLFYGAIHTLLDYAGLTMLSMPPERLGVQHGYVFEFCEWEKSKIELRNWHFLCTLRHMLIQITIQITS